MLIDKTIRQNVLKNIRRLMKEEIKAMCSGNFDSMLRYSTVSLQNFTWESVWLEMRSKAPICLSILDGCLPQTPKSVTCLCFAMLAKSRNPKMSVIQSVIALILRAGHAGSQVS